MFEWTFQQRLCCAGVAQGGLLVEPEHYREGERASAVDEGFLKLPIGAQAFQGGFLPLECRFEPECADRACFQSRVLVDQQVGVGCVGPADPPVVQPAHEFPVREFVQWTGPSGDSQAPVAQVDVVDLKIPDLAGSGGVDGGQGDDEPVRRPDGGSGRLLDLVVPKRLDQRRVAFANPEPGSWIPEHSSGFLGHAEQGPQSDQRVLSLGAVERVEDVQHVVAGDFAQLVVMIRPGQQHRTGVVEVVVWLLPEPEQSATATQPASERARVLWSAWPIYLTSAAAMYLLATAGLALPALLEQREIAVGWAGPLLTGFAVASIAGGIVYGMCRWTGSHRTQSLVLLVVIACLLAFVGLSPWLVGIAAGLLLGGILQSALLVSRNLSLREQLPEATHAAGYSVLYAGSGIGYGASGIVMGAILATGTPVLGVVAGADVTLLLAFTSAAAET